MAVMKLEATNTVSCDVDIDKIIEDYGIDRFTKYYELQKIALKVLHSNWNINSSNIDSLTTQLVSQLAIRLKAMKAAPITVKDLQYAIDNKKFIDFGKSFYEVVRAEITDTYAVEDQVIINTKFILKEVDQKTVADIMNVPYFESSVDYSTPYTYMANIAEVNTTDDLAQMESSYPQAVGYASKMVQSSSKEKASKSTKQTKATKTEANIIPEEKDDYNPFAGII